MTKNPLVKPYLKWAGGKGQLKDELKKHIPKNVDTYYEPFIGAGALFFELSKKKAVINDTNFDLINSYKVVKNNLDDLIPLLKEYEGKNNRSDYYKIRVMDREKDYTSMSDIKKAARFIYLNKTCYNGLYRVNSMGLFNTPFGSYKSPAICNEAVMRAVSSYLNENKIRMENGDFEVCVKNATDKDFVYFDPPYHSPEKTNFTGYQSGGFDEKEQERLFKVFVDLADRGIKCMLSNSSTDFIKGLYSDFTIDIVKANRAINSDPNGRGTVDEVIITSW